MAIQLLDLALSSTDGDQNKLMAALYPSDSHPDDNPVFVLCRNDNCSFTWTGEMHIHQVSVCINTCSSVEGFFPGKTSTSLTVLPVLEGATVHYTLFVVLF